MMTEDTAIALSNWQSLLQPFRVEPILSQKVFFDLATAYGSSDRLYHNLAHIQQVLQIIYGMRSHAQNPAALEFATWFHDVIYNPKANDNEEKSAEYAAKILQNLGISAKIIYTVNKLILITKNHQASQDIDSQILLDADLSILGASEADYGVYTQAIRQEYSWLSQSEYRLGRKQVLQKFLERERIYLTEPMFAALEIKARQNIQAEIRSLSEGNLKKILE
jgi:predicted metal-dependent HD superfamily phosphohydrolase